MRPYEIAVLFRLLFMTLRGILRVETIDRLDPSLRDAVDYIIRTRTTEASYPDLNR